MVWSLRSFIYSPSLYCARPHPHSPPRPLRRPRRRCLRSSLLSPTSALSFPPPSPSSCGGAGAAARGQRHHTRRGPSPPLGAAVRAQRALWRGRRPLPRRCVAGATSPARLGPTRHLCHGPPGARRLRREKTQVNVASLPYCPPFPSLVPGCSVDLCLSAFFARVDPGPPWPDPVFSPPDLCRPPTVKPGEPWTTVAWGRATPATR